MELLRTAREVFSAAKEASRCNPDEQSTIGCAHVRFAPGAHTAWHHHPKGQTLYVTDGIGLVATRTGGVQEIRYGTP